MKMNNSKNSLIDEIFLIKSIFSFLQRALAERDMNSAKEKAEIRSESTLDNKVSDKSSDMERRRRVSSSDRDRAKNDDNNNVESATNIERCRPASVGHTRFDLENEEAADRDDHLHRIVKCPSRTTEVDDGANEEGGAINFAKTSPLRISIGGEHTHTGESSPLETTSNIDSLSKTLHINDEIINIIANSKSLLVNGEHMSQEVAAKNERVSTDLWNWGFSSSSAAAAARLPLVMTPA